MNQLKVIANEMLPVYQNDNGEKFVNARELHEQMLVKKDFTTWVKERVKNYGFTENEDYYLTLTKIGERQNVTKHEYWLTLDTGKEFAMVQNNEAGRAIRKYFIEVEKRSKQPKTQAELIYMLAQQNVANEKKNDSVRTTSFNSESSIR
ncbi:antA/AntB antirepressor family protein [Bacillus mobilis]|uniref:AntA/AntB antirepressor family protein n=1 Tax=Bacillus mobilis TaxID=2026190 RepID=A0ABV4S1M1_9BACI